MTRAGQGIIAATLASACVIGSCPARADDKAQCLAASEQGQNQRDDGHYRAARESFLSCSREVCPKVVAQSCTRWLNELDQQAPTIVLAAKDALGNDLTEVRVSLDGATIATRLDGTPIQADAGEHVVRFEREGSTSVELKVVLRAGEKARVLSATLEREGTPDEEPARPAAAEAPTPPPRESFWSGGHVAAGAMGLSALAAAGVGAFFLVQSSHAEGDASALRSGLSPDACYRTVSAQPPAVCQALADKVSAQHTDAAIGTGLLVGGGVLGLAAVAAWLLWPRSEPSTPSVGLSLGPGSGALMKLEGSF
jgi:hypothetical protein